MQILVNTFCEQMDALWLEKALVAEVSFLLVLLHLSLLQIDAC